jgi:hypothetical protein
MIRKLKDDSPTASERDFGILAAKAKARTSMTKSIVVEKQAERAKLSDESSRVRKTVAPKGAKPIRSARPMKKAAKNVSKSSKRR